MARFGPYELLLRLGTGATAEVHLASGPNKAGATLFALKILLPHLSERGEVRDQLVREAKLASTIHHPNVAEVFDAGEEEGRAYLAMEYVRGYPLSALLRKLREAGESLTLPEACFAVRETALGLHEAHEAVDARRRPLGLVHRDVSPQNVMVRDDGRIKVVDFGLAKLTAATAAQTAAFSVGGPGIKGKIPYMSPEQVRSEPCDRRADVFSASAILFELLTGRRLYPGASEEELIQQALVEPLPDPVGLAPTLPDELVEVMMRGLDRDRERRTASAGLLAEALRPFVTEEAKGRLAWRMEKFFDSMPRTVEEARMAAMAQRTSGQPLGAVRTISRTRSGDAITRAGTWPPGPELTTLAAPFATQSFIRTDPAGTDPSATRTGPPAFVSTSREVDLPGMAESPPALPLIRAEVTVPGTGSDRRPGEAPTRVDLTDPSAGGGPGPRVVAPALVDRTDPSTGGGPGPRVVAPALVDRTDPSTGGGPGPRVEAPTRIDLTDPSGEGSPGPWVDAPARAPLSDLRPGTDPNAPMAEPERPELTLEPNPEPMDDPSFRPPPAPRSRPRARGGWWAARLSLQQAVGILAAVAAVSGLGVGLLIKRFTAEERPARPNRRIVVESPRPVERPADVGATGAAGGEDPRSRPEPEPASATGRVVILSEPMAVVTEDGRELGTTPYVGDLPAGAHQFLLRSTAGSSTARVDVTLRPGEQVTRRVTLR